MVTMGQRYAALGRFFSIEIIDTIWLVVWNIWIIFPYIGNNHPNWLIFFRGVQTTNQVYIFIALQPMVCLAIGKTPFRFFFTIQNDRKQIGWELGWESDWGRCDVPPNQQRDSWKFICLFPLWRTAWMMFEMGFLEWRLKETSPGGYQNFHIFPISFSLTTIYIYTYVYIYIYIYTCINPSSTPFDNFKDHPNVGRDLTTAIWRLSKKASEVRH